MVELIQENNEDKETLFALFELPEEESFCIFVERF